MSALIKGDRLFWNPTSQIHQFVPKNKYYETFQSAFLQPNENKKSLHVSCIIKWLTLAAALLVGLLLPPVFVGCGIFFTNPILKLLPTVKKTNKQENTKTVRKWPSVFVLVAEGKQTNLWGDRGSSTEGKESKAAWVSLLRNRKQ